MRILAVSLLIATIAAASTANAARVDIYDRATGENLPTFHHKGRLYVAGEPGHEYEIRIHSDSPQRVLAVTSVDGVNVISGQTGAVNQSGYVLDPYGYTTIEGWRKNMSRTAAFYFTKLPDSYAARTGRPENVGVIGVALFRERTPCCRVAEELRRSNNASEASGAPAPATRALESADQLAKSKSESAEAKLGTGHGRSEYSAAQYTEFERASNAPDETIVIYYDSVRNLVAQGVMPAQPKYGYRLPQAFPGSFVPDP
jgi:hypothetical protein